MIFVTLALAVRLKDHFEVKMASYNSRYKFCGSNTSGNYLIIRAVTLTG